MAEKNSATELTRSEIRNLDYDDPKMMDLRDRSGVNEMRAKNSAHAEKRITEFHSRLTNEILDWQAPVDQDAILNGLSGFEPIVDSRVCIASSPSQDNRSLLNQVEQRTNSKYYSSYPIRKIQRTSTDADGGNESRPTIESTSALATKYSREAVQLNKASEWAYSKGYASAAIEYRKSALDADFLARTYSEW